MEPKEGTCSGLDLVTARVGSSLVIARVANNLVTARVLWDSDMDKK